jgi:hypothetical protein
MADLAFEPSILAQLILARDAALAEAAAARTESPTKSNERQGRTERALAVEILGGALDDNWARQSSARP